MKTMMFKSAVICVALVSTMGGGTAAGANVYFFLPGD